MEIVHIEDCFLVREAQSGNHVAFKHLVHAHDQAVLRLAFLMTRSQSDAQDICQEVFLRVYKKLSGFRFECSLSTWIYRIATHACLDHLRKNRNNREDSATRVDVDELLREVPDDRPNNPEQQLLRRELSEQILCALQILTPRERMVFELKHFQGLKLQTVSQILNTSEASVKASLFRATQKLRFQLASLTKEKRALMKRLCDTRAVNQAVIPRREKSLFQPPPWSNFEHPNLRTANGHDGLNLGHRGQ
jgi:RNA polymerase sigma-70 factor, ECF subfamily